MDHASRVSRLTGELERPLLVTNLTNIRYLSGFAGSNAFLLATPQGCTFVTDGRYGEAAAKLIADLPDTHLEVYTSGLYQRLADVIGSTTILDLEAPHVSWALKQKLDAATSARLEPGGGLIERHRLVKDGDEIAALQAAAAAGDAALEGLDRLREGSASEGDLGDVLIEAMRDAGGDRTEWPPIVAVGANASRPHHRAGSGAIKPGVLLLDYGCEVDGYHSDMTRTIWLGGTPEPEVERVYDAVREANEAGISAVRPGITAGEVDAVCRAVLANHGLEEFFVHSTGHGVGLDIHERPSLRKASSDVLEAGQVLTVEPGVYLQGRFGVRIEDMVLVTEDGHEVITKSSKEFCRS